MTRPTRRQFKKVLASYKLSEYLKDSICDGDPSAAMILERVARLRKVQLRNQKNKMHKRVWRLVARYIQEKHG